ncbi:MAG: DUF3108 domain-containing protein [Nitrospinota bacterium]
MVNRIYIKYQITLLSAFFFLTIAVFPLQAAHAGEFPFSPGEKLVYEGTWLGISAGRVEANVDEVYIDGIKLIRFSLHAYTTGVMNTFWTADDHFDSYWNPQKRLPRRLEVIIRESNTKKDKTIDFFHGTKTAIVKINERDPVEKELNPAAQDFFSSGYFIRMQNLIVRQNITFPIFEDNKNYDARIEVIKKERISILGGEVDTIMIKPILKLEGAMQKRGQLWVWLTDDEQRVPAKLRLKMFFGSIYLKLIEAKGVNLKIILPKAKKKK